MNDQVNKAFQAENTGFAIFYFSNVIDVNPDNYVCGKLKLQSISKSRLEEYSTQRRRYKQHVELSPTWS
jgi:hypothetical protein